RSTGGGGGGGDIVGAERRVARICRSRRPPAPTERRPPEGTSRGSNGMKMERIEAGREPSGHDVRAPTAEIHGRASRTRLKGVSVARRTRVNPALVSTSPSRFSPAWAPSAPPSYRARDACARSGFGTE